MTKTSTGIKENVAGLLCYLALWVTGLIFILLEQDNKFVRFHAMQSIIVFGALNVISIVLGFVPILGRIIWGIVGLIGFALWIVLMIRAYQGVYYKLPIAGDLAEQWSGKS